jgi:hypothetical protein
MGTGIGWFHPHPYPAGAIPNGDVEPGDARSEMGGRDGEIDRYIGRGGVSAEIGCDGEMGRPWFSSRQIHLAASLSHEGNHSVGNDSVGRATDYRVFV